MLPEVPRKGKAKVTVEQVAHDLLSLPKHKKTSYADQYIFQRHVSKPTGSSRHDESPYALLGQSDNEEESKKVVLGADEGGQVEGQAGPDPKQVLLEEPTSSSGTLSSLQHVSKDISFGDLFFSDRPLDADKNAETKVESMVNVLIQQAIVSVLEHIMDNLIQVNKDMEERLDKHRAHLHTLEQLDIPNQVSKAISEVVTDAVNWAMQAPLRNHFRDLPEADMKEILHQRMWETESYKTYEDHTQLFEALEKSMNRDHSEELAQDLAEAREKKKKSRESPKMPPGSPPHHSPLPPPPVGPSRVSGAPGASRSSQVPPPPPPPPSSTNQESPSKGSAAPTSSKTVASAEYQAWTMTDVRLRPSISMTPIDLETDKDMGPDDQA
nr:hypothetical protein [Tanacetum cinerariifolium]